VPHVTAPLSSLNFTRCRPPSLAALCDAELALLTEIDATQGIPTQSTYLSLRLPKARGRIGDLSIVLVTFGSYD